MIWKLRCVVLGHEDRMRSGGGKVYLECEACGRQTHGWQLGRERRTAADGDASPLVAFQHLAQAVWQRVTSTVRL